MKIAVCSPSMRLSGMGIPSYAHDFISAFPDDEITIVSGDFHTKPTDARYDVFNIDGKDLSTANARKLIDFLNGSSFDVIVNSGMALMTLVTPYIDKKARIVSVSHFVDGFFAWLAGKNNAHVDRIVTLSSFGNDYIRRKFGIEAYSKCSVVFNHLPDGEDREYVREPGPVRIVFPGGSNRLKGCDLVFGILLDLLKSDLDFEFFWIGDTVIPGRRHLRVKCLDIADILPADSRIKRVGRVARGESERIMRNADIFLLPSRGEGFPISLCEALQGYCVPLISDSPHGSLDFIADGKTGFILPQRDRSSFVDLIKDILRNPARYEAIKRNAHEDARKRLSPATWRDEMRRVMTVERVAVDAIPFSELRYIGHRAAFRWQDFLRRFGNKKRLLINAFRLPFKRIE